jgi:hypothetical protein
LAKIIISTFIFNNSSVKKKSKLNIKNEFIFFIVSRDEKEFIRFLNMAINDVTYLLDESLQLLKKIHDIETDMDNKDEWEATSMV